MRFSLHRRKRSDWLVDKLDRLEALRCEPLPPLSDRVLELADEAERKLAPHWPTAVHLNPADVQEITAWSRREQIRSIERIRVLDPDYVPSPTPRPVGAVVTMYGLAVITDSSIPHGEARVV